MGQIILYLRTLDVLRVNRNTPHFEYCADNKYDRNAIWYVTKSANRAMRVILHCGRYTKIECTQQVLQFMSIKQRLYCNVCIFIYKILNNTLPVRR